MYDMNPKMNRRILVVDDNEAIHEDYKAILGTYRAHAVSVDEEESAIFGGTSDLREQDDFEVDSAFHGQEGLEKVRQALEESRPYAMAFVDVRMLPGWDGVETVERIWQVDSELQIVICTAHSDYTWQEMAEKLGKTDKMLILKKPFENLEVYQLACALSEKWLLNRQARMKQKELERRVRERTVELASANDLMKKEITERKHAHEAMRLAYKELEQINYELKEVQSQIIQSEKLASIGQLAAGVAHEMNTPVGFVLNNFEALENYTEKFKDLLKMYNEFIMEIETLEKTELMNKINDIREKWNFMKMDFILEDIHDLFNDSKEGLERVINIIQNLRDFSRVDQTEDLEDYNINDGIRTTLIVAMNEIKYNADVKTDLSNLPLILCNSGQINQVFLSILVNAAQAITSQERDERGTITIRTYAEDNEVVCEISDDGSGIPSDKLSKVFDPFFTTKPVDMGTGLGLSISRDIIVNKHKGKLFVDSTVDVGTKFTIKLPIERKKPNEQDKAKYSGE